MARQWLGIKRTVINTGNVPYQKGQANMRDDSETSAGEEPLSELQRIEQLEKAGQQHRLLILGLAGALLVNLVAWITVAAFSGPHELEQSAVEVASQKSVIALQTEIATLQLEIGQMQKLLPKDDEPAAAPPGDAANARMLARILIGQEQNYQQTLAALRDGMRELAGMTPGSRSWLSFYEESLNRPMADSQARIKLLQSWSAEPASAP